MRTENVQKQGKLSFGNENLKESSFKELEKYTDAALEENTDSKEILYNLFNFAINKF